MLMMMRRDRRMRRWRSRRWSKWKWRRMRIMSHNRTSHQTPVKPYLLRNENLEDRQAKISGS
jgi:hypothetical protein